MGTFKLLIPNLDQNNALTPTGVVQTKNTVLCKGIYIPFQWFHLVLRCNFNPSICALWVSLSPLLLPVCTHVSRTRQTLLLPLSLAAAAEQFNEFCFDSDSGDPLLDEQLLPLTLFKANLSFCSTRIVQLRLGAHSSCTSEA